MAGRTYSTNNEQYEISAGQITTIPKNFQLTGTIETIAKDLIGTGTAFLTEVMPGSWIFDATNKQVRKVERVYSDTVAYLTEAFAADVTAGTTGYCVDKLNLYVKDISLLVGSGGALLIGDTTNFVTVPASAAWESSKNGLSPNVNSPYIDPIVVDTDTNTTTVQVTIQR